MVGSSDDAGRCLDALPASAAEERSLGGTAAAAVPPAAVPGPVAENFPAIAAKPTHAPTLYAVFLLLLIMRGLVQALAEIVKRLRQQAAQAAQQQQQQQAQGPR